MLKNDPQIAGTKTPADWQRCKEILQSGADAATWEKAIDDYFITRLDNRYRGPIKVLQDYAAYRGEGFSILTIQCSLIEYLESTIQGKKYRYGRGQQPRQWEYTSSQEIFIAFLTTRHPFSSHFDRPLAEDFYANVRCGLLHEARTKGNWIVLACDSNDSNAIVDREQKIVFRDGFQNGLNNFVDWYRKALPSNIEMQQAFIRKFDDLCI